VLGRAWRWTVAQLAFLAVLAVLAAAFGYLLVEPDRTARVSGLFSAAMLLAGLIRAALPTRRVGLLAVRARWVDIVLYLALGGVILALDLRLHV
jgi:Protein of unknown function (DUF3017)